VSAEGNRSRFVSALLGFLVPGLGHVYVGRAKRFVLLAVAYFVVVFGLGMASLLSTFGGMAVYVCLLFALYLFGIVDPPLVARPVSFKRKWYNRWYGYVGWIAVAVVALCLVPVIREPVLGFSVFRVPGIAMVPAIEPRDIVLVDTRVFVSRSPAANDVVVVRGPHSGLLYIRRVSGQPSSTSLSLVKDNPEPSSADLELKSIPVSGVIGKVTCVFFSWKADRIGRRVE
jgi:signal peptidase I